MKFNVKKLLSIGNIISLVAVLGIIIGLIIYSVNINSVGYFRNVKAPVTVTCAIFAIILFVLAAIIPCLELPVPANVMVIVRGVCVIAAVALSMAAFITLIGSRAEGLAYIYFSDANLASEIQTPANMSSAGQAIYSFVFLGAAWLVGLVSSFFAPKAE